MIYILESKMLPKMTEEDKKVLSLPGTDRVIIFSDKKSSVSIETMQFFMSIKAKTDFVQLEDIDDDNTVIFCLGYQYGLFSAKCEKDKVVVLTDRAYSFLPDNMVCLKNLSEKNNSTEKTQRGRRKKEVKEPPVKKMTENVLEQEKVVEVEKQPKIEKKVERKKTVGRPKSTGNNDTKSKTKGKAKLSDLSANSIIKAYPELEPFQSKLTTLNGMFIDAIRKSTESNVSLKMQLQMVFAEDTDIIWSTIKKDFAKLKMLADISK